MTKNKKLIINLKKNCSNPKASIIHRENVEIVDTYKYLATILDSNLKFDKNQGSIAAGTTMNPLDADAEFFLCFWEYFM